jgi:hypothetical protein
MMRRVVPWLLALMLPTAFVSVAARISRGSYWARALVEGLAVLLALFVVGRVARGSTFRIVAVAFGIPYGLMALFAPLGYVSGPRPGDRIVWTLAAAVAFPAIWFCGLLFAYLLGRRYRMLEAPPQS